nr:MAG TPA: Zinc-finger double domain protein [Caudoviricetes sp.]
MVSPCFGGDFLCQICAKSFLFVYFMYDLKSKKY